MFQEGSSYSLFDGDQEPPPKRLCLDSAGESFKEESGELVVDQHQYSRNKRNSSHLSIDEDQEPPLKRTRLVTAADPFQEGSAELVTDQYRYHDIQDQVESSDSPLNEGQISSPNQCQSPTVCDSIQEKSVEPVSELDYDTEGSSLGLHEAAAAAVKSVCDNTPQSPHSHSEPSPFHEPRITGYDVELVKESLDLRCPICLLVLCDPMQVSCCGKRFCEACIETVILRAKPCPACNHQAGYYNAFEDKGQKQAISKVEVHCSNAEKRCGWRGKLSQLNHHLHSCPQQPYTCPYCKHSSSYEDISSRHLLLCEEFPVHCKFCAMKIPRKSIDHHHSECEGNTDPSITLPVKTVAVVPPSSLFVPPPHFIMVGFSRLKMAGFSWFSPPFYSHIGGYKLCLCVYAKGKKRGAGTHVSVFVCLMRGEYDDNLTWPFRGSITFQLINQIRDGGHVKHTVVFDDSTPSSVAGRVTEGKRELGQGHDKFISLSALPYDKSWNSKYLNNNHLEFQITQVTLSKPTEESSTEASSQQSRITAIAQQQPELHAVAPINIIMNDFIFHKVRKCPWYSPPFYSHPGGYKMCLKIHANGDITGNGTHVSVGMLLMNGECDDSLTWPIRGEITYRLLNQRRDEAHIEHTQVINENTQKDRANEETDEVKTLKHGHMEFISHSALHYSKTWNTQYLNDDQLEFKIVQVKLTNTVEAVETLNQDREEIVKAEHHESLIIPPVSLTMSNFITCKMRYVSWYSSPFYSHIGGYKMCLRVDANEVLNAKHVSVFVCLMQGENDDNLTWPFRGEISFRLVNQRRDEGHVKYTEKFDSSTPSASANQVELEEIGLGWGDREFIPHSAVQYDESWDTEYLRKDSLEFQIHHVKLSKTLSAESHHQQSGDFIPTEQAQLPPVNIIMKNFISYKGRNAQWYSPPFYSHIGGYKMCLKVRANGSGSGESTHISVFVCFLCGDYDDKLTWPFRGDVTFRLVNRSRNEYVEHTATFDACTPDNCAGRVTAGRKTQGWGSLQFIPHTALHYDTSMRNDYLEKDSLHFQVSQVKLKKITQGLQSEQPVSDKQSHSTHASKMVEERVLARNSEEEQHCDREGSLLTPSCETHEEVCQEAITNIRIKEQKLKDHFAQLKTAVSQKIQKRLDSKKIKTKNFWVYMKTLFPPEEGIPKTTDVFQIFAAITNSRLWDHFHYQPLERVANMYGGNDPHLKAKLEAYIEKVNEFELVTKVADYSSAFSTTGNESTHGMERKDKHFRTELTVKLKIENTLNYLSHINDIWKSLSQYFNIPQSLGTLENILEESWYITWLIPAFYVPKIMEMAKQPEVSQLFQDMKIDMMTVDGAFVYGEEQEAQTYSTKGNKKNVSSMRHKQSSPTSPGHEQLVDKATGSELQETKPEKPSLDLDAIEKSKTVTEKPSPHLHTEPHKLPHSPEPQVTGYNVELVTEYSNIRCPICRLVPRDPMQVNCCGSRLCRACIEAVIDKAQPCPSCNCKSGNYDTFEDKGRKQEILELSVFCSNRTVGCDWTGELCQLENHLNLDPKQGKDARIGCQYAVLKCIHCSEDHQRLHMQSCPQQPYTCPYCKQYSSTYEVVSHYHFSVCEQFPLQCKVCSMEGTRKSLQQHHFQCKGSTYQSTATVGNLSHESCNYIMTDFTTFKNNGIPWLSPPFYSHIGGYKMYLQVHANGEGSGTGTHVSVFVHLMNGKYDDNLLWPFRGSITFQLINQRWDGGHVEHTATFDDQSPNSSTCQVTKGEGAPTGQGTDLIPHYALYYDKTWNTEYIKSDRLEFRISKIKLGDRKTAETLQAETHEQPSRDASTMDQCDAVPSILPVNIVMSNVISYKVRGVTWYSPPFYSSMGGYRMCLRIDASRDIVSSSSFMSASVSVFLCLLRGEFDDNLIWPFRGCITIQLVNQKMDEAHVERTVIFDDSTPSECAGRVTGGERGLGLGFSDFIPHSALHYNEDWNTEYIKEDNSLEFDYPE